MKIARSLDLEIIAKCRQLADLLERRAACSGDDDHEQADPIATKVAELRATCRNKAIRVSGDDHISEAAAAEILNYSPHTLKNWRYTELPILHRKSARGRIEYALEDLARFLVETLKIDD